MVKAYEKAGEAGIVQLSACSRNEGVSWAQIAKADQAWADYTAEHELPGGIYRWGAGPGKPKEMDFYSVWITESLEQHGSARTSSVRSKLRRRICTRSMETTISTPATTPVFIMPVGGTD